MTLMSSNSLLLHRFQVPCHIQEKFYLIFSRFNISDIQYPHFLYTPLICQRHLLVYQGRMDSPQPKIIMRTPPIRYMIIYPVSSLRARSSAVGNDGYNHNCHHTTLASLHRALAARHGTHPTLPYKE